MLRPHHNTPYALFIVRLDRLACDPKRCRKRCLGVSPESMAAHPGLLGQGSRENVHVGMHHFWYGITFSLLVFRALCPGTH
jgi:hypothetical protein